jgi:hypothetical protein
MSVEVDINVGRLQSEIKKTYASVSEQPTQDFIFPTGRAWAEGASVSSSLRLSSRLAVPQTGALLRSGARSQEVLRHAPLGCERLPRRGGKRH